MDKVVHFEIPADDIERAKKFYSEIFGWIVNDMPEMEYTTLTTAETDEETHMLKEVGAINGGMMKRDPEIQCPVVTIEVKDIDTALGKIMEMGGTMIKEKMEVPDMGFAAYFRDPEGNILGLWQNKS